MMTANICVNCGAPLTGNKCEYCGAEYGGGCTGAVIAISEVSKIAVDGVGIRGTRLYGTHNCDDSSFGLADFNGFRKVE